MDERQKRPANTALGIELQTCRSELHNNRILASEAERFSEARAATLAQWLARSHTPPPRPTTAAPKPNTIYTVRFDFGSTHVGMPAHLSTALIEDARSAPLVVLRGRTDGMQDLPAESRVARGRAEAVRDFLIRAGIDAARIRTTYQPSGDQVADNTSRDGRAMNRRVEIEVYRTLPIHFDQPAQQAPRQPTGDGLTDGGRHG